VAALEVLSTDTTTHGTPAALFAKGLLFV